MAKWSETHQQLQRAALELCTERGYDATTAAQIAERAGVSEMTLFRHFPNKAALIVEDPFDPAMADSVLRRPDDEPPMRALAEGIRDAWSDLDATDTEALRVRLRLVAATPSLRVAVEGGSRATVEALARALIGRGVDETQAGVAASAVIAGLGAALLAWAAPDLRPLGAAVDAALDTLGG